MTFRYDEEKKKDVKQNQIQFREPFSHAKKKWKGKERKQERKSVNIECWHCADATHFKFINSIVDAERTSQQLSRRTTVWHDNSSSGTKSHRLPREEKRHRQGRRGKAHLRLNQLRSGK